MSGKQQRKKTTQRAKSLSEREPRTGLLSLLAVAGALVGFAWWRKQQQAKSQKPKKAQESESAFRSKTQNNKKSKGKERREEIKARQNPAKGEGREAKDDKDKDPLVLNYSYFVPDRADRLGTPAQRMTLPAKQDEKK
ncbi:hypothetical protein COCSUDRAFT_61426 [Coccomyxa subellipsoidea C-169]|uniref:Uncharacterized protein n=1 Tax=Coccomyxa subellipsoidea (strain C-169) TaxID=574566 RepID=I0Z3G5_COCSC|nr:hypothetical protein COCSUDRAFT_61426 [Coccomyxa subellipsoidea C-169]EIE25184.1 hypothetical protein COCSUDRAFT_61426 [Coccomyxa subellipsoidea C-169]|eukprot:XP_005649728.1 hypothetical protein COCSUDRAFT_61426 [Coccomyxa subellipsoidea C-169]